MAVLVADERVHIGNVVTAQGALLPDIGEGKSVDIRQGGTQNLNGEVARRIDISRTLMKRRIAYFTNKINDMNVSWKVAQLKIDSAKKIRARRYDTIISSPPYQEQTHLGNSGEILLAVDAPLIVLGHELELHLIELVGNLRQ